MKKILTISLLLMVFVMLIPLSVSAITPYATYTYSIDGEVLDSPDVYVTDMVIDSEYIGLEEERYLTDVRDLKTDSDGNVYIVEAGHNRVLVLDRYYKLRFELEEFVNDHRIPDSFSGPQGVFVSADYIYVCDSNNSRIVMFYREDGKYCKTVQAPVSDLFDEGDIFTPIAVATDSYGRMFVVSSTTNQGIIVMDDDGSFYGFIGAQKVTYNALDWFWRTYLQKNTEGLIQYVPTEYNNITVDDKNFVFATISSIDEASQKSAIESKDTSGDYAPVKKLNAAGDDVMRRNGFYPPSGEVKIAEDAKPSKIIDVAIGPDETWSILDEDRSKVYTYDKNGNLLFAFGDKGSQTGNINSAEALAYQTLGTEEDREHKLIVLDKDSANINFTVYRRTEYGDILMKALVNQNERRYDEAKRDWEDILKRNNNFDLAYIGIGLSQFRDGQYEEAAQNFKSAHDVTRYSQAFVEIRKVWSNSYFWTIPLIIIAIAIVIWKALAYTGKVNQRATLKLGHKTFGEELCYASHLVLHPFDGFWDLKHERRGSIRAAIVFLVLTIVAFFYKSVGTGYIFNSSPKNYSTIFQAILSVAVPFFLFVVANWCLTTLLEGEGTFKDVFIATGYSIAPMPFLIILSTIVSNFLAINETALMTMINTIAFVWVGILLFFGIMITHGYSFFKNIITIIATVVGMAFIMFLAILFSSLMTKIVSFVYSIFEEINYRV
jgi:tetratricopeptide (TPR) repeat protein